MELPSQPQLVMKVLVDFSVIPWTAACQAPLFIEFSRSEYWSGLPFPFPGDLPNPGTEPRSPALEGDSLPDETPGVIYFPVLYSRSLLVICFIYSSVCMLIQNS